MIYESGPWNGGRPFAYDLDDPLGRSLPNKLLHNYLTTGRGQCVSMPTLFLILADRLGLNVSLVLAPDHVFVRYTDAQGRSFNLETTSGGHPARDEWVRQNFPMGDLAVRNGLYLRSLSKREAVAVLALTVVEHLFQFERFEAAVAVCEVLLRHHPRDVNIMLSLGSAHGKLLDALRKRYPIPWTAPPLVRARMHACMERNRSLFAEAERLGWIPEE